MPQPTAYQRTVDFTERDGDDTNHAGINAELDAAALSVNQIRANLAQIQKDDGTLANNSVGAEQLAPGAFNAVQASLNAATQAASGSAQSALTSALSAQQAATDAAQTISTVQQHAAAALLNAQGAATSAADAATSAASINPANLVQVTGDQTIAGIKTFSSPPVVPADSFSFAQLQNIPTGTILGRSSAGAGDIEGLSGTQALALMGAVGTTGNQTIGGVKTFSAFPVLPRTLGGFYKANPNLPAFVKTGGSTLSIRAQTRVEIAGAWVEFLADTAVSMPALEAGTDYAIWCSPAGALQANADPFNAPATPPVAGARRIGGFHFGLVAPGTTPAGGGFATTGFTNVGGSMIWTQAAVDRIAGINEFSIWDLAWRCKGEQRGMALDPQTEVWHAIYFCSVNHIVNGISRNNTDVASGTVLPRIPLAYGGNGSTNYGRLSQYECEEIAASFGLRLPNVDEFRSAMFGVTEAQSLGGAASTIPLTARQAGFTSRLGIEQATGHQWIFARGNSAAGGSAWIAGPNRGDAFGNPWVILLGGARDGAAGSGSRASNSSNVAWVSPWSIAFRAAGDLLRHV